MFLAYFLHLNSYLVNSKYHLQGTNFEAFSSVTGTLKLKTHSQLTQSPFTGTDCLFIDYNLHHVCVYGGVMQFSLKLLQLHIFGKLLVLMNFYTLQYFGGLVNFGLLLSE